MRITTTPLIGKRQTKDGTETIQHPVDKVHANGKLVGYCGTVSPCHIAFIRVVSPATAQDVLEQLQAMRSESCSAVPTVYTMPPSVPLEILLEHMGDDDESGDGE